MSSRDPASTADDEALPDDFQKRTFGFFPRARRPSLHGSPAFSHASWRGVSAPRDNQPRSVVDGCLAAGYN